MRGVSRFSIKLGLAVGAAVWMAASGCPRPRIDTTPPPTRTSRAVPIPAAASRTPDLALPLAPADRDLALVYLDDKLPPRGRWDAWPREEIEMELAAVSPETVARYGSLLDALAVAPADPKSLEAPGALGSRFKPAGTEDAALDARLLGQILPRDLVVGRLHDHYFVFYRRYPSAAGDAVCPDAGYCRLVIVDEVATRPE